MLRLSVTRRLALAQWVAGSSRTSKEYNGVTKYDAAPTLSASNYSFDLSYVVGLVNEVVAYETFALGPYEISQ